MPKKINNGVRLPLTFYTFILFTGSFPSFSDVLLVLIPHYNSLKKLLRVVQAAFSVEKRNPAFSPEMLLISSG
jgi:hypothetical protein